MRILEASFLLGTTLGFSQESYGTWYSWRNVTVNTTFSGANVSGTQVNFPLLVRLGAAEESVFARSAGDARDLRFVKSDGVTRLKHQIERWDPAGKSAAIWVLMDTVYGNNATQSFRVYYGKAGAGDSANGAAVFDTANGFQGVFHLAEATDDTVRDATVNRFKGIPRNRGGMNPRDTAGAIGRAKNFLGSNANNNGGSYRIVTSTGGNTFDNNPLNFRNDSATRDSIPQYTVSAWINVSEFPYVIANRKGIIAKSIGASNRQYFLRLRDPIYTNYGPMADSQMVDFSDGVIAQYKVWTPKLVTETWFHVAATRRGERGNGENLRICVNGQSCGNANAATTVTIRSDFDVYIGSYSNDSGYFSGLIDEVRLENIARDSMWFKLSYETQKPGSAAVSVSGDILRPCPLWLLNYRTNPLELVAGVPMIPDTSNFSGDPRLRWSVTPNLPLGLVMDTLTGIISGTPVTPMGLANYAVVASGPCGGGVYLGITVTAAQSPQIVSQPVSNTPLLLAGFSRYKIGVQASGLPSPSYQWIRTRGTVTDTLTNGGIFSGATTDSLMISYPQLSDSGSSFKCRVVNAVGSAVSQSAVLHVQSPTGIEKVRRVRVGGRGAYSFRLPEGVLSARLIVEALDGRAVWAGNVRADGNGYASWDGTDGNDRPVPNGMYVMRVNAAR